MSLNAAAVFAPYVRLELLQWDPIFTGQAGAAQVLPCDTPAATEILLVCSCDKDFECHAHAYMIL
jgi:hypothetical protein